MAVWRSRRGKTACGCGMSPPRVKSVKSQWTDHSTGNASSFQGQRDCSVNTTARSKNWIGYPAARGRTFDEGRRFCVSSDGHLLLSADRGIVRLRDLGSGQDITPAGGFEHALGDAAIDRVAFSRDGRRAMTYLPDASRVFAWDVSTGRKLGSWSGEQLSGGAEISPDGTRIAACSNLNHGHVWDVNSGEERLHFTFTDGTPKAIRFSADGRRLLIATITGKISIRDAASGEEIRKIEAHRQYIKSFDLSADGQAMITGSLDRTAGLWDLRGRRSCAGVRLISRWREISCKTLLRITPPSARWPSGMPSRAIANGPSS